MNVEEIIRFIEEIAPKRYAESWDNVGLMVGSRTNAVNKILVCLDVTSCVIEEAIHERADLILSHHPFLFSKLKSIDADTVKGMQIQKLIKNEITVISAHTNLDFAENGINDKLAEVLQLKETIPLKSYIPDGTAVDIGMGKTGKLRPELEFNEYIKLVKTKLNVKSLRVIGQSPQKVGKVSVFCGSFDGDLAAVQKQNLDLLITGDIKYHTAMDAVEMGLCIIDVGHFASEYVIVPRLKEMLENRYNNLEVVCSKVEKDPFITA